MAENVTVGKPYFEALLRRADFHTNTQLLGREARIPDPTSVTVSKNEYDSLLRTAREYDVLKNALFEGGITPETLNLLISGTNRNDHRKDSGISMGGWEQDFKDQPPAYGRPNDTALNLQPSTSAPSHDMPWRPGTNSDSKNGNDGTFYATQAQLRVPNAQRQLSNGNGQSDLADEVEYSFVETINHTTDGGSHPFTIPSMRSIFFHKLPEQTTHKDLTSVIKGGKLLDIHLRQDRTANVSFFEGAADYLAWAKRNDVYLYNKRVEVKWADRQFSVNNHVANKITNNGATRNILIRGAAGRLAEQTLREDMEHIQNLVIIDVQFRGPDALVSTNSVHNALFARTCMMSRSAYRGCKIEFYADECDVPLPTRAFTPRLPSAEPVKKMSGLANRFDLLNMDGTENGSVDENRTPSEASSARTIDEENHMGVSLRFLESEASI